jgi:peroxiredoxin
MSREIVSIGQQPPDFTLHSQDNKAVRLSDYRGKRNVILYFTRQFA